jgi:hypothetical protein
VLRKNAKKNLERTIKEVLTKEAEAKCFAANFASLAGNAAEMYVTQLSDIEQGITQNQRIGAEVIGNNFELLLNIYNKTNNELFVRFAVLEEIGRGGTVTISDTTGLFRDPPGNVTSFTNITSVAENGHVMWPFDKSTVKVLKEKVLLIPKNNGGSDGATRTIKWYIPYKEKIRWVSDTATGPANQNRRIQLVATAWAPVGGTQTTYTYQVDGWGKFNFKDI